MLHWRPVMHASLRALSIALVGSAMGACGGAASATAPTTPDAELTLNIPAEEWARIEVPEGGLSLEAPGQAARRVVTRDESQTFEYLVTREPIAVVVAVERLDAIVVGDAERTGLDAVAALYGRRSAETARACTPSTPETITVAGHEGRLVPAVDCRRFSNGSLVSVAFMHGPLLLSVLVLGTGVGLPTIRAVMARTIESIELAPAPSWFQPVDTDVAIANVPGLTVRMPHGVVSEVTEQEGSVTARYTSEPLRGMAAIVSVTTPATLTAAQYCAAVTSAGDIDLVDERSHLGEPSPYCQVRGRVAARPELFQIHDVRVIGSAVVEMMWVGPFRPEFVSGGDAQLAEMRASLTAP